MHLRRLISVVGVLLVVGACGPVHPGQAAVVDGKAISMKQADATARVYCRLAAFSGSGAGPVTYAEVRRAAVSDLALAEFTREIAERRGVHLAPSAYVLTARERAQLRHRLSPSSARSARVVFERNRRTEVLMRRLHNLPDVRRHVTVDPRFNTEGSTARALSVAAERSPRVLPVQVCQP